MTTRQRRGPIGPILLVALLVALALPSIGASASSSHRHVVSIRNIAYNPGRLVIGRGDRVTWRFVDPEVEHNVTPRGHLKFTRIGSRITGSATRTFNHTGTYKYICTIHLGMSGSIVVR